MDIVLRFLRKMRFFLFLPLHGHEILPSLSDIFTSPIVQKDINIPKEFFKLVTVDGYCYIKKDPTYTHSVYFCLNMENNNVLYFDQKSIATYISNIAVKEQQQYLSKHKENIFSCKTLTYLSELHFKGIPTLIHKEDAYAFECLVQAYYLADFLLCHEMLKKDIVPYDELFAVASKLFAKCLLFDKQIVYNKKK